MNDSEIFGLTTSNMAAMTSQEYIDSASYVSCQILDARGRQQACIYFAFQLIYY